MTDLGSFNKHILLKEKNIIPLMQGGMGVGVSFSGLAGAVASCNAIGIISTAQAGFAEPDFETNTLQSCLRAIDRQIKRAKEIAQGRGLVGVNVMTALRHYKEHVAQAVRSGADIIVCGAGLPLDLPGIVRDECEMSGVKKPLIAPIVSSQRAAKLILKHWSAKYNDSPDIVVVEGPLAGGHLGYTKDEAQNPQQLIFIR